MFTTLEAERCAERVLQQRTHCRSTQFALPAIDRKTELLLPFARSRNRQQRLRSGAAGLPAALKRSAFDHTTAFAIVTFFPWNAPESDRIEHRIEGQVVHARRNPIVATTTNFSFDHDIRALGSETELSRHSRWRYQIIDREGELRITPTFFGFWTDTGIIPSHLRIGRTRTREARDKVLTCALGNRVRISDDARRQ